MSQYHRPLGTKCFQVFLTLKGFSYSRTKGSHDIWVKKGSPMSIPVRGNDKQVPADHIRGNCRTIGCTVQELYAWADKNC
jgi:hypothetical protein